MIDKHWNRSSGGEVDLPNPRRDKFPVDVMIRDNKSNGRIATAPPPRGEVDLPSSRRDLHPLWRWEDPSPPLCPFAAGKNSGSLESLISASPTLQ